MRIAFRMGVHVYEASSLLEAPQSIGVGDDDQEVESWAYVIPGTSAELVQEEIDAYNKNSVRCRNIHATITAASTVRVGCVSLTGETLCLARSRPTRNRPPCS